MATSSEVKPGRRLRLTRRKVGLEMVELAEMFGISKEDLGRMERDVDPLSPQAQAFIRNPPAAQPAPPKPRPPRGKAAASTLKGAGDAPAADELPPVDEQRDGVGPIGDAPPLPGPAPPRPRQARAAELAGLEADLTKLFCGEKFLVPREQPDGTVVQVEAVIPGMAQLVGMVDEFDGMVIEAYGPGMARAWAQLAAENEMVRKILIGITYGGAYRGVVAATLPPVLAIVAHHGLMPQLGQGGQAAEPDAPAEHPTGDGPVAAEELGGQPV